MRIKRWRAECAYRDYKTLQIAVAGD